MWVKVFPLTGAVLMITTWTKKMKSYRGSGTSGDGHTGTGETTTHTYDDPSPAEGYTVTLTVTDDEGATDSAEASGIHVIKVTNVGVGEQTPGYLYLANNNYDEPDARGEVTHYWHELRATLDPADCGTPSCFSWNFPGEWPTVPRIYPTHSAISTFWAKDQGMYIVQASCGSSARAMIIYIAGVDIKTSNIDDVDEMDETYNIFLNENFDQEIAAETTPDGHSQCYDPDHSDENLTGDAADEYGQISFTAATYGDPDARVTFQGSGFKLYDSSKGFLEFDDDSDGSPSYDAMAIGGTLYVEGTATGTYTLTTGTERSIFSTLGI